MQHTYWAFSPTAQNSFERVDLDAVQGFCHFLFHLFHISKLSLFEDFFSSRETKNVAQDKIR